MKDRSRCLGVWVGLSRLLLAVSVLLGTVTFGTRTALAEDISQNPPDPQGLRIAQGAYLDYQILASDVLVFTLDVLSPAQGVTYYWSVENEPVLGDAVVEDTGESSRVRYFPKLTVFGEDGFTIALTSSIGGQARIHISVTVDPAEGIPGIDNPDPLSDLSRDFNPVFDEEDYPTGIRVEVAGPTLIVTNWFGIQGKGWAPSATVTLTIKPDLWVEKVDTNGDGDFVINPVDFALKSGHVIEATDGASTVTYTMANLTVTHTDVEQEFIRGTTDPGAEVQVIILDDDVGEISHTVTSDDTGVWRADFWGMTDIVVNDKGVARQIDDDGNQTNIYFDVKNPTIEVRLEENVVRGFDWPKAATVTLEIGPYRWLYQLAFDDGGRINFTTSPVEIQAGQILRVTDGIISRSYRVPELEVTAIDEDGDLLSGTAYYGKQIEVFAYDPAIGSKYLYVTPNASGFWEADFSSLFDIKPGTDGFVRLFDEAGNAAYVNWSVPDPIIVAYPEDDYIRGMGWPLFAEVSLTIDGVSHGTEITEGYGSVHFALEDVRAGQLVTMTSGTYNQTYRVANLAIEEIDETADTLRGKADPGENLITVSGYGTTGGYERMEVSADAAGDWVADFSGSLDIGPGSSGSVQQTDSAGNYSIMTWRISLPPNPMIFVSLTDDIVEGSGWIPDTELIVTIGDEQWTMTVDNQGRVLLQTPIEPGDVIRMTDGKITQIYTTANLSIVEIDESQDLIRGTADKNAKVEILIWGIGGRLENREVTANQEGGWLADFSGFIDIGPGATFLIFQQDDANNATYLFGYVPDPSIEVILQKNLVLGTMWPPDEEITLAVAGNQMTMRSSPMGEIYFDTNPLDIEGQALVVSGGGYTMGYEPWTISMPQIDYSADVMRGTVQIPSAARANAAAEIQVSACSRSGCVSQYPEIDSSGHWEADFSGVIDLGIGVHGYLLSNEEGNVSTRQNWQVYGYYFPISTK